MPIQSDYHLLLRKLDEFIRRYYLNQVIRGAIYTGTILLAVFLVFTGGESQFYFSTGIRTTLFYLFILGGLFTVVRFMGIPLSRYWRLGKTLTREQAARIIGTHFPEVEDRLLNVLQLHAMADSGTSQELLEASIQQKMRSLNPLRFPKAVNLSLNRRYLRYFAIPFSMLLLILLFEPGLLTEGTSRLFHHNTFFEKKAPFQFFIKNKKLETLQFQDYELEVKVTGEALPEEAWLEYDGIRYKMQQKARNIFAYTFTRPQKSVPFHFYASGFTLGNYQLEVLPKPMILQFETALQYPAYTGRVNESIKNTGDLQVPQGTRINWSFLSQNTEKLGLRIHQQLLPATATDPNHYTFSSTLLQDAPYAIYLSNSKAPDADSMNFSIQVIPDQYPSITVTPIQDSALQKLLYFAGDVSDDYGISRLELWYSVTPEGEDAKAGDLKSIPVPFSPGRHSGFSQSWELSPLQLKPGDQVNYYFEVWDNDAVNGNKSTRSVNYTYRMPDMKEFEKKQDQSNQQVKDDMQQELKKADQLQQDYQQLEQKMQDKKNLDWNDRKQVQDLLSRQEDLQKDIQKTQQQFQQSMDQQKDFKTFDPDLMQKQQQLQDLFKNVLNPEMQDMIKKMNDLLDQMNKDKTLDQMKQNQLNNADLKKEMDRMLSLFKQMEFQQKYQDITQKLDSLASKQDQLNQQTEDKNNKDKTDDLKKQQDSLNKQFEDIQKEMQDAKRLNDSLDNKMEMPDTKKQEDQIQQDMQQSSQNLQQKNSKDAGKNQKSASKQMKDMEKQMQDAMNAAQMEQNELDMDKVRQLLKNLIKVSFDQEDLIDESKQVNVYNPKYLDLIRRQRDMKDNLKMVEDSITELAKTQFKMKSYVQKQVKDIEDNLDKAVSSLEDRQPMEAASSQQFIMTSVNNLALIFEETLQSMQQEQMQSQNKMAGSGQCKKPGGKGSKPSFSQMQSMQKQLGDQLQQMMSDMKNGKKPGKDGQNGMSQQLAQMAQQQSMIRQMMQQMMQQNDPNGPPSKDLQDVQKKMDDIEKQLVNKQLGQSLLDQQQQVYHKLLDYEKAEKTQGEDDKRKANTAQDMFHAVPPEMEEYLKKKQAELDLYKTVPPGLAPFYKNLVEDYYKDINK